MGLKKVVFPSLRLGTSKSRLLIPQRCDMSPNFYVANQPLFLPTCVTKSLWVYFQVVLVCMEWGAEFFKNLSAFPSFSPRSHCCDMSANYSEWRSSPKCANCLRIFHPSLLQVSFPSFSLSCPQKNVGIKTHLLHCDPSPKCVQCFCLKV